MTVKHEDWLSPLNKILIRAAVRTKAPQVRLRDGRTFSMTYKNFTPAATESYEVVELKPLNPKTLVPRGTFKVNEVKRLEWLGGSD